LDRSLKAAHNFGTLVADHLRDGSKSLSLAIWRGTSDRPNTIGVTELITEETLLEIRIMAKRA
jgi:hypothetical protein